MASQGAQGHGNVAQLCFGKGDKELNLSAVQQRVNELIRVIDKLLLEMQTQGAHWISFLDKLAVINMTHMQIMTEVRPLLRQYVVYPKFVDNPGIEEQIPELLASRLLPEQIEQETAWLESMPGYEYIATQPAAAVPAVLEYAQAQIAELQDLVAWLVNKAHTLKARGQSELELQELRTKRTGVLDPKGDLRKDIDAMSAQIAKAAEAAAAARRQAGVGIAGKQQTGITSVVVGQKRPRPNVPGGQQPAATPEPAGASEEDQLLAKIMSGVLWPRANVEKQAAADHQAAAGQQPSGSRAAGAPHQVRQPTPVPQQAAAKGR